MPSYVIPEGLRSDGTQWISRLSIKLSIRAALQSISDHCSATVLGADSRMNGHVRQALLVR